MQRLLAGQEELTQTLTRAREIAEQSPAPAAGGSEYEPFLRAAEEFGIPREAMLQALRERQVLPTTDFAVGETVFAPSVDGSWYPATLMELGDHTARLQFLNGDEHTCARSDLRPLALVPGRRIEGNSKTWGWWQGVVEKYEPRSGKVTLSWDGWGSETFPIHKLRLPAKLAAPPTPREQQIARLNRASLMRAATLFGGAGVGIGLLLAKLLPFLFPFLGG